MDSVFVRETVYVRDRPDTVTVERERTVWRDRTRHDTVVVRLTDTVRETVEVERAAPAPPPAKGGNTGWAVAAALFLLFLACILLKRF